MKQDYQIWNILHDGELTEIKGTIPGRLTIKVEIKYLANILQGQYDHIIVILQNCTLFEYERLWKKDEIEIFTDLAALNTISPKLMALSCDEMDDYLLIYDICGSIKTRYDSVELRLEDGNSLSFQELDNASQEYWENFGKK